MMALFSFVDFGVGVSQFRVSAVLADHPHPAGRFPCRRCKRQDVPTRSRYVDTVRKLNPASGLLELVEPSTANHELAVNTFRREHLEAGPLCEDCFSFSASSGVTPPIADELASTRETEAESRRVQP